MIEFHKVANKPSKRASGTDHVWFSTHGTYVADNKGNPTQIGAGALKGKTIPSGKPPVPNILYYASENDKHYISNETTWNEIPLKGLPGTGSVGADGAGGVIVSDPGNLFSSNDVEGVLYEIGDTLRHVLGPSRLVALDGALSSFTLPGERALGVANSPTSLPSWLIQRRDTSNRVFGLIADEQGVAHIRYGDQTSKLASQTDIEELEGLIEDSIESTGNTFDIYVGAMGDRITSMVRKTEEIEEGLEGIRTEYETLFNQTHNSFRFEFNEMKETFDAVTGETLGQVGEIRKYINFESGDIVLGQVDNEFSLRIMKDRISFAESGNEVAFISNQALNITHAEITDSMILGKFAFMPRGDGSMDFGLDG